MAFGTVLSVVPDLYVVDGVRNQVVQFLVIEVGTDFKVTVGCPERIIATENEMDGTLRFDILVQFDNIIACGILHGGS